MSKELKKYRYLLMDWDGCLQNTPPIWIAACQEHFQNRNLSVSTHDIVRIILPHLPAAEEFGVTDIEQFKADVLHTVSQAIHTAHFHDQVIETLCVLQQLPVKISIVSSSVRELIENSLSYHNQPKTYFHKMVTRLDVQKTKPDKEPVVKALRKLQAKKKESIIIGDSHVDVLAGQAAGIDTAWYYPPENEQYYDFATIEALNPTYIIRNFSQILQLV